MKEYNEYEDKLVSFDIAVLADQLDYKNETNGYDVECFTCSDDTKTIFDSYSGLIGDGEHFLCHRPTLTGLQKWIRKKYSIHIWLEMNRNLNPVIWNLRARSLDRNLLNLQLWSEDYEETLSEGIKRVLEILVKEKDNN